MALLFNSSGEKVDCGNNSSLNNLDPFTWLGWVRPTLGSNGWVITKADATTDFKRLQLRTNGSSRLRVERETTLTALNTAASTFTGDVWQFIAATYDDAASTETFIYRGTLTSVVVDVSDVASRTNGAGAETDDSGGNFIIGNRGGADEHMPGRIAWIMCLNVALTLSQIRTQQFHPHVVAGTVGFWHLGFLPVASSQPDWSGNGNNGTVTDATLADHVPLGPPFGFDVGLPFPTAAAAAVSMVYKYPYGKAERMRLAR